MQFSHLSVNHDICHGHDVMALFLGQVHMYFVMIDICFNNGNRNEKNILYV